MEETLKKIIEMLRAKTQLNNTDEDDGWVTDYHDEYGKYPSVNTFTRKQIIAYINGILII